MKEPRFFKHPTALVESSSIGAGTRIWAFAHILKGARIGRDCNVGDHSFVEGGAVVGSRVTLKNGVAIWGGVTLANDVFVGPNAVFTNDLWPRSPRFAKVHQRYSDPARWLVRTRVGRGASIGANATIRCGIDIGAFAMIGAGAVVTATVPARALVVGVPGRIVGWVCECGTRLPPLDKPSVTCPQCGTSHRVRAGRSPRRRAAAMSRG